MSDGTNGSTYKPDDPDDRPVGHPPEADPPPPKEDADYFELGTYIKEHLRAGDDHEERAAGLVRRTTVERWYAGWALKIVHQRETKDRRWVGWCQAHGLNIGTCHEAMRLYERSGSVEKVRGLTITEARKQYQTHKKTWTPPGGEPQQQPQRAAKKTPKLDFQDTEHLKKLRAEMGAVAEAVAEATEEDWRHADPDTYLGQIDDLMAKLRQARQAIRDAYKATVREAKAAMKASSKVEARPTVTRPRKATGRAKATTGGDR